MPDSLDLQMIMVVGIAAFLGYRIVGFIISKIKGNMETPPKRPEVKPPNPGPWEDYDGWKLQSSSSAPSQLDTGPRYEDIFQEERRYGAILGLTGTETPAEIRRKYQEKVAEYDSNKVSHLGPKFQELAEQERKKIEEAYKYFQDREMF